MADGRVGVASLARNDGAAHRACGHRGDFRGTERVGKIKASRVGGKKGAYEVGYSGPPKCTQFKIGRSGKPLSRPKGTKIAVTIFRNACEEKIRIKSDKGSRMVTKYEAVCIQLAKKAVGGDLRRLVK